jgi:hypothetical protein
MSRTRCLVRKLVIPFLSSHSPRSSQVIDLNLPALAGTLIFWDHLEPLNLPTLAGTFILLRISRTTNANYFFFRVMASQSNKILPSNPGAHTAFFFSIAQLEKHTCLYKLLDSNTSANVLISDTAAINAAIAYQNNCGSGCMSSSVKGTLIYFPPGTYLISSPIEAYYYTQLVGDVSFPIPFDSLN